MMRLNNTNPFTRWANELQRDAKCYIQELPDTHKIINFDARFPLWTLDMNMDGRSAEEKVVVAVVGAKTVAEQICAIIYYITATRGYFYSVTFGQVGSSEIARGFLKAVRRAVSNWPESRTIDLKEKILRELDELTIFIDEYAAEQYEMWQEAQANKRRTCMSDDMGDGDGEKAENDRRPTKLTRALLTFAEGV